MIKLSKRDIILLKQHDEDTLDKIRLKYINIICYFIKSHFREFTLDEIQEIANDAFVKAAYIEIDSFDAKNSTFSTWLFTITKNECLNFRRKRKDIVYQTDLDIDFDTIPTNEENDESHILFDLERILDEQEYTILIEYHLYNYSLREIAHRHNISTFYVRSIIKKAIKKVRAHKEELL